MASLAQIGHLLRSGGRAHVFEATIEGKPMAIKAFHTKDSCRKELAIYEYLKTSGHHPDCLPNYHGPIRLTLDHIRTIESSACNATYRVAIGLERIEGSRLGDCINDMSGRELESIEKKMLEALVDLHKTAKICHKDIKADNILLLPPHASRCNVFVIIDLGEGIIRKDTPVAAWKKACNEDIQALRDIFKDARSRKAVLDGCQLIHDATSTSHLAKSCGTDIPKHLSDELQMQLSQLLHSAQSAESVSRLIDKILLTVKHPICELALTLVRVLRSVGRFLDALCVLGSCVPAERHRPSFNFQKAKVLQSLGLDSMLDFESAVSGFEALLGADHITTQSCRCELAIQCVRSGDTKRAESILAGLAKSFEVKVSQTRKQRRLYQVVELRLSLMRNSGSRKQKRSTDTSYTEISPSTKRPRLL